MKFTNSVDGIKRATVRIEHRVGLTDLVAAILCWVQFDKKTTFAWTGDNHVKASVDAIEKINKGDIIATLRHELLVCGDFFTDQAANMDDDVVAKAYDKVYKFWPELKEEK